MDDDAADWEAFVKAHPALPVPLVLLDVFVMRLLASMNARNKERNTRLTEHAARITALEARPQGGPEYAGVFEDGKTYRPGQLVTKRGLWLCTADTTLAPGTAPTCWKLVCKERSGGNRDA